jgi:hypothetical protein
MAGFDIGSSKPYISVSWSLGQNGLERRDFIETLASPS